MPALSRESISACLESRHLIASSEVLVKCAPGLELPLLAQVAPRSRCQGNLTKSGVLHDGRTVVRAAREVVSQLRLGATLSGMWCC